MSSTTTPPKCRRHRLSFVCVNDVYSFDDPPPGGWCRAATLIRRLTTIDREDGDDGIIGSIGDDDVATNAAAAASSTARCCCLAVANGDVLGGSSILVDSRGSVAIDVMNTIPMNLACLGNHEFDHGDYELMDRIDESDFDWLGSNVYYPRLSSPNDDDDDDPKEERTDPSSRRGIRRCRRRRRPQEMVDEGNDDDIDEKTNDENENENENDNDNDVRYYFPGIHGNGVIRTLPNDANNDNDNNNNIKVGIFGLVTDLTPRISSPSKSVIFDSDVLSVARRVSRSLRRRGAKIIIALTHLREMEDRMLAGDSLAGIDLILGGHEHEPLAIMVHRHRREEEEDEDDEVEEGGEYDGDDGGAPRKKRRRRRRNRRNRDVNEGGVLVFKCGMNAYWVGTVDLDIIVEEDENDDDDEEEGAIISSISTSWSMHAVNTNVPMDNDISEIVRRHRGITEERAMATNFGMELASTLSLDTVVATIAVDVDVPPSSSRSTPKLLPLDTRTSSVRRREATGGNMIADAMRWTLETNIARRGKKKKTAMTTTTMVHNNDGGLDGDVHPPAYPTLAMINGGFIRGDGLYGPGCEITVRDVLKEMPFPRTMEVLMMRGEHLREALAQQLKGSSRGPTGAFPHLSSNASLRYGIGGGGNSSAGDKDSGEGYDDEFIRVHTLTVDGLEVIDERKYFVAVTSFVADGSEGCTSWSKGERVRNSAWDGVNMSCVLLKYLQHHRIVIPVLEGRVVLQK